MNVQELYDHITKYLTPEQALLKILEGQVRTYENFRVSNFSFEEGEAVPPIVLVIMAAQEMEWNVCIPNASDDDEIRGMIIGTQEYVDDKLDKNKVIEDSFEKAIEPAIRYLLKNHNPHTKIYIDYSNAELLQGAMCHNLNEEVPD